MFQYRSDVKLRKCDASGQGRKERSHLMFPPQALREVAHDRVPGADQRSEPTERFVAVVLGSGPLHHRRREMLDRRRSDLVHGGARFLTEDFENTLNTRLTEGAKAPQIGPPDAYGLCAHGKRFDDICAATEAAVDLITVIRPPTASITSGKTSIVARPLSTTRPPWFETMIPSMPLSAASFASSCVRMPLSTIFILTVSRRRMIEPHVRFAMLRLVGSLTSMPS